MKQSEHLGFDSKLKTVEEFETEEGYGGVWRGMVTVTGNDYV